MRAVREKCGHRWASSPSASAVTAVADAAAARHAKEAEPIARSNTSTLSRPQLRRGPLSRRSVSEGGPPAIATFFSSPPAKKATHRLSGDQKGNVPPSVPSIGRASPLASGRTDLERGLARATNTMSRPSAEMQVGSAAVPPPRVRQRRLLRRRDRELDRVWARSCAGGHPQCDDRGGDHRDNRQRCDEPCDAVRSRRHGRSRASLPWRSSTRSAAAMSPTRRRRSLTRPRRSSVRTGAGTSDGSASQRGSKRTTAPSTSVMSSIRGVAPSASVHTSRRPDVAALVGLSSLPLFRPHAGGGSEDDAEAGQHGRARDGRRRRHWRRGRRVLLGCQRLREPEVQHLHGSVRRSSMFAG